MIDPRRVALFIPPGLKKFKLDLFEGIGRKIGHVVRHDFAALDRLPDEVIPIIGCTPELRPLVDGWVSRGRPWIYWDRGYARRVFATWLPKARTRELSYYRWHLNSFQMREIRDVPNDRWRSLHTEVLPWVRGGRHIEVAGPSQTYMRFHKIEGWTERTIARLKTLTDRPITVSDKESKVPLYERIKGAHAVVTHGSNAAVEAAIMGCPVFVDPCSAAALIGQTDLARIETPIYPDREPWLRSLAYSQFNEHELVDGTLWRLME